MQEAGVHNGVPDAFTAKMDQLSRRVEEWKSSRPVTPVKTREYPQTPQQPASTASPAPAARRSSGEASPFSGQTFRAILPTTPSYQSPKAAHRSMPGNVLSDVAATLPSQVAAKPALSLQSPFREGMTRARPLEGLRPGSVSQASVYHRSSRSPGSRSPAATMDAKVDAPAAVTSSTPSLVERRAHDLRVVSYPAGADVAAKPVARRSVSPAKSPTRRSVVSVLSQFEEGSEAAGAEVKEWLKDETGPASPARPKATAAPARALQIQSTPDFDRSSTVVPAPLSPEVRQWQPDTLSTAKRGNIAVQRAVGSSTRGLRDVEPELSQTHWERVRSRLSETSPSVRRDTSPGTGLTPSSRGMSPAMEKLNRRDNPFQLAMPRSRSNSASAASARSQDNEQFEALLEQPKSPLSPPSSYRGSARGLFSAAAVSEQAASVGGETLPGRPKPASITSPAGESPRSPLTGAFPWGGTAQLATKIPEKEVVEAAEYEQHDRERTFSFDERMTKLQRHVQTVVTPTKASTRQWLQDSGGAWDQNGHTPALPDPAMTSSYAPSFSGSPTSGANKAVRQNNDLVPSAESWLSSTRASNDRQARADIEAAEVRLARSSTPSKASPARTMMSDDVLASRVEHLEDSLSRIENLLKQVVSNGLASQERHERSQKPYHEETQMETPPRSSSSQAPGVDSAVQKQPKEKARRAASPPRSISSCASPSQRARAAQAERVERAEASSESFVYQSSVGRPSGMPSSHAETFPAAVQNVDPKSFRSPWEVVKEKVLEGDLQEVPRGDDMDSVSIATPDAYSPPRRGLFKWPLDISQAREALRKEKLSKQVGLD
eukprot:TRINITY_DN7344_c0_g1_i2.p1 TRINITY_DN7344_c0_g1~~TRINITY_DN7344_c0_g1_i2.p1  ORF type:complete len:851 (-),score=117.30 TRINITY_DN7344_c0_g1_i2:30-2528(-)